MAWKRARSSARSRRPCRYLAVATSRKPGDFIEGHRPADRRSPRRARPSLRSKLGSCRSRRWARRAGREAGIEILTAVPDSGSGSPVGAMTTFRDLVFLIVRPPDGLIIAHATFRAAFWAAPAAAAAVVHALGRIGPEATASRRRRAGVLRAAGGNTSWPRLATTCDRTPTRHALTATNCQQDRSHRDRVAWRLCISARARAAPREGMRRRTTQEEGAASVAGSPRWWVAEETPRRQPSK